MRMGYEWKFWFYQVVLVVSDGYTPLKWEKIEGTNLR